MAIPFTPARFRKLLKAKVKQCGGFRPAADDVKMDYTRLNRLVNNRIRMEETDFLTLLKWLGGRVELP